MLEVRREHFTLLEASIWGVGLHAHTQTHALYLHKETEIGLLIAVRQTDLKGQQTSLQRGTCLVVLTVNRKKIGDLNSQMIKSTLTSVTDIQDKGSETDLSCTVFCYIFIKLVLECQILNTSNPILFCKVLNLFHLNDSWDNVIHM